MSLHVDHIPRTENSFDDVLIVENIHIYYELLKRRILLDVLTLRSYRDSEFRRGVCI